MPITDSFTGTDGASIDAAGWNQITGTWTILSNKAKCGAFVISKALRTEAAFPNDQYAQAVVQAVTGESTQDGVYLRSTIKIHAYEVAGSTNVTVFDSGGFLVEFSGVIALDTPFTLKGSVTGSTVTIYKNGVSLGTATTVDTSGKPGMFYYTNGGQPFVDDFECTDAAVAVARVPYQPQYAVAPIMAQ